MRVEDRDKFPKSGIAEILRRKLPTEAKGGRKDGEGKRKMKTKKKRKRKMNKKK